MKSLIAGVAALGLSSMAFAEDTSRDDWLITSANQETIQFIVESLDHSVRQDLPDQVGVVAVYSAPTMTKDLVYAVQGKACQDGPDCLGLNFYVIFTGDFALETANTINQKWSAIKASVIDGDLYLTRYLILDRGQTIGNLKTNLSTTLAIAEKIQSEEGAYVQAPAPPQTASGTISFGDDSGEYAKDGGCDDARFKSDGDDWNYQREHVLADATDCQRLYQDGQLTVFLDFGNNSGEYADDDTCDDNRFTGPGRSILLTDSHIKRDAQDCIAAYRLGTINRP